MKEITVRTHTKFLCEDSVDEDQLRSAVELNVLQSLAFPGGGLSGASSELLCTRTLSPEIAKACAHLDRLTDPTALLGTSEAAERASVHCGGESGGPNQ